MDIIHNALVNWNPGTAGYPGMAGTFTINRDLCDILCPDVPGFVRGLQHQFRRAGTLVRAFYPY